MQLFNSTAWSDEFLKRMVAWCCRQLGYQVGAIQIARFRKMRNHSISGVAHTTTSRFAVTTGPDCAFPMYGGYCRPEANEILFDRLEALVAVTAHEIQHLVQSRDQRLEKLTQARKCEADARWHELHVLRRFRRQRQRLLADWSGGNPSASSLGYSCAGVAVENLRFTLATRSRRRVLRLAVLRWSLSQAPDGRDLNDWDQAADETVVAALETTDSAEDAPAVHGGLAPEPAAGVRHEPWPSRPTVAGR